MNLLLAAKSCIASLLAAGPLLFAPLALANDESLRKQTDEARKLATRILSQIRSEMGRELENGGPLRAVVVCKYSAPEITSTISRQSGARVTRISLKPRNRAIGEADAWEQGVLLDFERQIAKGEKAADLEYSAIVHEPVGSYFRYVKAIPMNAACLACHGPTVSEAMKSLLSAEYPHDKAVDYAVGQLRGAVSIKKPL